MLQALSETKTRQGLWQRTIHPIPLDSIIHDGEHLGQRYDRHHILGNGTPGRRLVLAQYETMQVYCFCCCLKHPYNSPRLKLCQCRRPEHTNSCLIATIIGAHVSNICATNINQTRI